MGGGLYVKSNWTRIVGIVLAAALGLALLFYLGGLICQVHQNYVQWIDRKSVV